MIEHDFRLHMFERLTFEVQTNFRNRFWHDGLLDR